MIGLEYILMIYNQKQQSVADYLGIKHQNINLWIKGKQMISKKHLPKLERLFGISQEYFQKELTDVDKLVIKNAKLQKELEENNNLKEIIEKEDSIITQIGFNIESTNGELYYDDKDYFLKKSIRIKILKTEIMKRISDIKCNSDNFYEFIKLFIDIAEDNYRDDDFKEIVGEFIDKMKLRGYLS